MVFSLWKFKVEYNAVMQLGLKIFSIKYEFNPIEYT